MTAIAKEAEPSFQATLASISNLPTVLALVGLVGALLIAKISIGASDKAATR